MALPTIDAIVADAIDRRVFPGAVVMVSRDGQIEHRAAYGTTMYDDPDSRPVETSTIYDVASLTKMITATAALRLLDQGRLSLESSVQAILPEVRAQGVTIAHLLAHTSGLDLRLSALRHLGRAGMLGAIYDAEPQRPPGAVVAYTNVNSLLLGEIIARLWGAPLDEALHALVLAPLGLRETRFLPPVSWLPRIAPTEIDAGWRGGLVHGTVHDESTHALGGVAGHAGLFSTAADMHAFCAAWLTTIGANNQTADVFLRTATAIRATTNQTVGMNAACGLGWMMDRPNFMGAAPAGSFGHTGFTGPAIVIVPAERLVVVVLSNRVYPQRQAPVHHGVIAAVVDAARGAVTLP